MCEAVLETLLYRINEPLLEHKEASLGVLNSSDVQKAVHSMGTSCTELCGPGACSWAAAGTARMGCGGCWDAVDSQVAAGTGMQQALGCSGSWHAAWHARAGSCAA